MGDERPLVRRTGQGHPLQAIRHAHAALSRVGGADEPDEGVASEVGDEEAHLLGPERDGELPGDHVDGVHRRRRLDGVEQGSEIGSPVRLHGHELYRWTDVLVRALIDLGLHAPTMHLSTGRMTFFLSVFTTRLGQSAQCRDSIFALRVQAGNERRPRRLTL